MVNDEQREVRATLLSEVLDELGYGGARIATALNGAFVPVSARVRTYLAEGVQLEILAPMQGG